MAAEYSVEVCRQLRKRFEDLRLHRPFRTGRYDDGDELEYDITPVVEGVDPCRVRMVVEKFVGGGYAGQVYRVRILSSEGSMAGTLPEGGTFALKILIPPGSFAVTFRNLLYGVGFQGPFQLQCNPDAARAGALWQKFIRRGAAVRFGDESAVNDVHGTFVDPVLGSCGEISDWIDGRTWILEVDDRVDLLRRWRQGRELDDSRLGSPEYRAKWKFMTAFVELLHDMGAHEFARQYYWPTWMSQPNALKRTSTDDDPGSGLVAVDFRAGLTVLPFLPMCPGDLLLIPKGIARGSLVQFDRGDLEKLRAFVEKHREAFSGMEGSLEALERCERIYRDSLIDVTHNHVRLLYSRPLWRRILDSAVTGWRVRNMVDDRGEERFRGSRLRILLFSLLGLIPLLGKIPRRAWGRRDYRRHYGSALTRFAYLRRAIRGKMCERAIGWHRDGRVTERKVERIASSFPSYIAHLLLSFLPIGLFKILTDWSYFKGRLYYYLVRPVRLYFDASLRDEWLREMVQEGRQKRIITEEDADTILSRIDEPFIQKYLKSLAVHVCTVPVTQVVSVLIALIYVWTHPEMPRAQAWGIGVGIIALFQVVPISPGSLVRGLYVVWLVIRERNFRDYNIAVFLGFFKYVGYLAFPIQMAYRYPTLARFMAAHWATEAVHVVPVFGENGALLEHKIFTLFYNVPLTLRGRMGRRAERRAEKEPRTWHMLPLAAAGSLLLGGALQAYGGALGRGPVLGDIWWAVLAVPLAAGSLFTLGAGGASLGRRIVGGVLCGAVTGVLFGVVSWWLSGWETTPGDVAAGMVWRAFVLAILTVIGAIGTEILLPEPGDSD